MKKDKKVRSSSLSIKFANPGKKAAVSEFVDEYARVVSVFVERFWEKAKDGKLPKKPGTELCKVDSWLNARALQCAAKQASGICCGAHAKNLRRLFIADKLWEQGQKKQSKKLRDLAFKSSVGFPEIGKLELQLDDRFFAFEKSKSSKWDFWVVIKGFDSRTRGRSIQIPLKSSTHWKKFGGATLLNSVRISKNEATFSFKYEDKEVPSGKTIGIDIGLKSVFSTSAGTQVVGGNHGHTLDSITTKITRRKKGSKGFKRACDHRKNFINESVNNLNFSGISAIRIENIKNMKRGKRSSRKLSHWSSRDIFAALESRANLLGVQVEKINPRWTSQRCSECGWVQRRNRKGEQFGCRSCGNAMNADLNAAVNISSNLPDLAGTAVRERWNLKGFFWSLDGCTRANHESVEKHDIVREARKPKEYILRSSRNKLQ